MDLQQLYEALEAQQKRHMAMPPPVSQPQVLGMLDQAGLLRQNAADLRAIPQPMVGGSGASNAAAAWMRRNMAAKDEEDALMQLKQAYAAQSGIDQYAAQAQALQAQMQKLEEEAIARDRYAFEQQNKAFPPEKRTTQQKNAEAMGLKPGSPEYNEYMRKSSGGVTVNTGNSEYIQNPDGSMTPREGSAEWYRREQDRINAEREANESERKESGRQAGIQRAGGTVVQDLGRAYELIPDMAPGDGVAGANERLVKSKVAGTPEFYVTQFIESAKSNIGLDRLQQMRDNSPTGGALGQVPIQQQKRLEQVLGQADVTMPADMLADNIHRIQNIYFDIMYGSESEREVLMKQGLMTPEENAEISGYYFDLSFDEVGRPKDSGGWSIKASK